MRRLIIPILLMSILAMQAITDIFHSATFFPFVHYAMFSDNFRGADSTTIYQITVNDKILTAGNFTLNQWSMIHSPLIAIAKFQDPDQLAIDQKKIAEAEVAMGVGRLLRTANSNIQNDSLSFSSLAHWYEKYLSAVMDQPVQSLRINKITYLIRNGKYIQLQTENWINL